MNIVPVELMHEHWFNYGYHISREASALSVLLKWAFQGLKAWERTTDLALTLFLFLIIKSLSSFSGEQDGTTKFIKQ